MGFFFRRSKKVGPFRLNLSKSGLGLSAGVKGARVSIGPRGPELHLGRKGLYYRTKLGSSAGASRYSASTPAPQLPAHYANLKYLTEDSNYFDVCRVLGMPTNEIVSVPPEAKIPNMALHYQGQAVVFLIFANDWTGQDRFDTKYIGTKSLYPEATIHVPKPDYKIALDSYPLTPQHPQFAAVHPETFHQPEKLPPWDGAKVIVALGLCTLVGLIVLTTILINDANRSDREKARVATTPTATPTATPTPVKRNSKRR